MELREAARQAIDALELGCTDHDGNPVDLVGPAITALRAALSNTQDWDEIDALRASLREHMAEIHRLRAAGRQALEALEAHADFGIKSDKAITALRAALAEANIKDSLTVEPVGYGVFEDGNLHDSFRLEHEAKLFAALKGEHAEVGALYRSPPKRKPLAESFLEELAEKHVTNCYFDTLTYARAVERAHDIGGEE